MTVQEYESQVWTFYLRLEKDFINSLDYISFSEYNFNTFSIELEKQLLSICSEIDNLCKLLCQEIDSNQNPNKMPKYAEILCNYNDLSNLEVVFQIDKGVYKPFANWDANNSPSWWVAYNKIKHNRMKNDNYKLGNLKNVFDALAGLYLLNRMFYLKVKSTDFTLEPNPSSEIFYVHGWERYIHLGNDFYNNLQADGGIGLIHIP